MSDDKFFKTLKMKLEEDVSEDFDKKFWDNFDSSFPQAHIPSFFDFFKDIRILIPTGAMTMLVVTAIYMNTVPKQEMISVADIMTIEKVLNEFSNDEIEVLGELETIDLTEEEWAILVSDAS